MNPCRARNPKGSRFTASFAGRSWELNFSCERPSGHRGKHVMTIGHEHGVPHRIHWPRSRYDSSLKGKR